MFTFQACLSTQPDRRNEDLYIQRDTEIPRENMDVIRSDVDLFVDGGAKGGLSELASIPGV